MMHRPGARRRARDIICLPTIWQPRTAPVRLEASRDEVVEGGRRGRSVDWEVPAAFVRRVIACYGYFIG